MKIARCKVQELINNTKDVYSVTFKKKDGEIRKMLAKQGVSYNLKGGTNKVVKPTNSYISTFDVNAFAYRTLNLATIISLVINDESYEVID